MSLFVSFEGGEGTGKTTQVELLTQRLRDAGVPCVAVREPGTTGLGWYVRDWLKRGALTGETVSREAELFLFAAGRAELVTEIIRSALAQPGTVVVTDRYADSSVAYQGYGRGMPRDYVDLVNDIATQSLKPDLTLLLDCPPELGLERAWSFQLSLPMTARRLTLADSATRKARASRRSPSSSIGGSDRAILRWPKRSRKDGASLTRQSHQKRSARPSGNGSAGCYPTRRRPARSKGPQLAVGRHPQALRDPCHCVQAP